MKVLFVSQLARHARGTYTISKYIQAGRELGHEVEVFGEQSSEAPSLPYTLDAGRFDFAVFVTYIPSDFPDLPYLARLLDAVPRDRRVIIDCLARYNDTIRIEHDFNHLEKIDGHQGWEWVEGFQAIADRILQPTCRPLRKDVIPFLFHGYDPSAVARQYSSPAEAAAAWSGGNGTRKAYGMAYIGNNWQRWSQIRPFLESIEPLKQELGPMLIAGWDWGQRPEWAVQLGIQGADVDPDLLRRVGVETSAAVPFDEVNRLASTARFNPLLHRPLYNHLGLVTNRTFETFCWDSLPVLLLSEDTVRSLYGPGALPLRAGENVAGKLTDMMARPEHYWEAMLKTRSHLARHHSFQQRFEELVSILAR